MLASRLRLQAVDGAAVVAAREGEGKGGNDIGIGVRSNQRWLQLRRARLHGLQVEDEGSVNREKKRKKMRVAVGWATAATTLLCIGGEEGKSVRWVRHRRARLGATSDRWDGKARKR
ncbi:hypothetical protein BHM03_00046641 [Ensete ventricosum]|nr:hypothetical protein BHM03_00046641 [Ensete ventricosum]